MTTVWQNWQRELIQANRPDEFEVKALLGHFGIATPRGIRLLPDQPLRAVDFAPPWVAKVCSPDILHKTDVGGVVLNLDPGTLPLILADLRRRFAHQPVLIEEQLGFEGPEFILGGLLDADFGPAVMAGAGGILTELYRDVVFRLAPCPAAEARRMLAELTIAPVLSGFRGLKLDLTGLAALVSRLGDLTVAMREERLQESLQAFEEQVVKLNARS